MSTMRTMRTVHASSRRSGPNEVALCTAPPPEMYHAIHVQLLADQRAVLSRLRKRPEAVTRLQQFKGSTSYALNAFLRDESQSVQQDQKEELRALSQLLSRLIRQSTLSQPLTVYRAVFGDYAEVLRSGVTRRNAKLLNRGFTSWTFDIRYALDFINADDTGCTLLRCVLPRGLPCLYIDGVRDAKKPDDPWVFQAEMLLDKGTTFYIRPGRRFTFQYYPYMYHMGARDAGVPYDVAVPVTVVDVKV